MTYKDIEIGTEIPPLTEKITIVQTVMYCAATWDFARQHYDSGFAQSLGFQRPVVDPQMYGAFLARMLTQWFSPEGKLKKLKMRYRLPSSLGDILTYKGTVVNKYVKDNEGYVDCDLLVENQKGEYIVEGAAVIVFQ